MSWSAQPRRRIFTPFAFQDWERDELITWCDADSGKRVAQGLGR
jgi:hypothetical protein